MHTYVLAQQKKRSKLNKSKSSESKVQSNTESFLTDIDLQSTLQNGIQQMERNLASIADETIESVMADTLNQIELEEGSKPVSIRTSHYISANFLINDIQNFANLCNVFKDSYFEYFDKAQSSECNFTEKKRSALL